MNTLKDFIIYLFERYPNPSELSKARLVKMLYLADWKSALDKKQQLTKIDWFYNHYGPYVDDVINLIKKDDKDFRVEVKMGGASLSRELVYLTQNHDTPLVDDSAKLILDFVIGLSYPLHWDKFIQLIYSTYPIIQSRKYSFLDLVTLAQEYRGKGSYYNKATVTY